MQRVRLQSAVAALAPEGRRRGLSATGQWWSGCVCASWEFLLFSVPVIPADRSHFPPIEPDAQCSASGLRLGFICRAKWQKLRRQTRFAVLLDCDRALCFVTVGYVRFRQGSGPVLFLPAQRFRGDQISGTPHPYPVLMWLITHS